MGMLIVKEFKDVSRIGVKRKMVEWYNSYKQYGVNISIYEQNEVSVSKYEHKIIIKYTTSNLQK